jgi:hypothetical protein
MDRKSTGVEFDREAFVPADHTPKPSPPFLGIALFLIAAAAVGFVGYKLLKMGSGNVAMGGSGGNNNEVIALREELSRVEKRVDELERRPRSVAAPVVAQQQPAATPAPSSSTPKVYHVTTTVIQKPDPAEQQRVAGLQKGVNDLQNDSAANKEAWQATTDQLARVSGDLGTTHGEIIRSQDQLNQLLSRTELTPIPFELRRSGHPQTIGPVSLQLKASNQKNQRYTLCVYIQKNCVELKDRVQFEVVQFATSGDSAPLEVIATKIGRDQILGYLEVPRGSSGK